MDYGPNAIRILIIGSRGIRVRSRQKDVRSREVGVM